MCQNCSEFPLTVCLQEKCECLGLVSSCGTYPGCQACPSGTSCIDNVCGGLCSNADSDCPFNGGCFNCTSKGGFCGSSGGAASCSCRGTPRSCGTFPSCVD